MKTIKAVFGASRKIKLCEQFQYDYNTRLQFVGIDLPGSYQVDFANSLTGQSTTMLGDADGVLIPAQYFIPGSEIYVWVFLVDTNSGYTACQVTIPLSPRAVRTGQEPTPEQQSLIDQAIATLNAAVAQTGQDVIDANAAKDAAEYAKTQAQSAQQGAELARQGAVQARSGAENAQQAAENARDLAQQYRNSAQQYARNAGFSADRAAADADRAEQAATNAGYLDVEIDENGHLIYTRTDAVDVDFELDNGHLIMEAI